MGQINSQLPNIEVDPLFKDFRRTQVESEDITKSKGIIGNGLSVLCSFGTSLFSKMKNVALSISNSFPKITNPFSFRKDGNTMVKFSEPNRGDLDNPFRAFLIKSGNE